MKKIMYFVDYPLDLIGGAQGSTLDIARSINDKRYESIIVTPILQDKNFDVENNIKIIEYNQNINGKTKLILKTKEYYKIIREYNPNVIHVQMPLSAIIITILKNLNLINKNIKIVFTDRGILDKYSNHTKFILKRLAFKADKIICTTEVNRKLWVDMINNEKKVITIGNMVSKDFEEYDEKRINESTNNDNFISDRIKIGFAGRITEVKNWPLAYEICKKLNEHIDFEVICATSAFSNEEKILQNDMIIKFKELLGNRFISKIDLNQKDMSEFYSILDIFIITSHFESFGKTAIEAMSRKCVVLTTDNDGTPEVVGFEDFVIDKENITGFVTKIVEYYQFSEKMKKDKEKLYNRYLNKYDRTIVIKRHEELYDIL